MRPLLGPLLLHGGFGLAGLGVLRAMGVVGSLRSRHALAAGGLAYVVGTAVVGNLAIVSLVIGVPLSLPVVAGIIVALCALSSPGWRPRPAPPWSRRLPASPPPLRRAAVVLLIATAILGVIGLLTVGNLPLTEANVDAWNQWTRKALLLFDSPHLPSAILGFSGDVRPNPHYNINPGYPLLLPVLEALHLRALGRADPSSVHHVLWLLGAAWVWAAGYLASRLTAIWVWAPLLCATALLTMNRLLSGYADVPLAYYLSLGVLALGLWLESADRRDLLVAVALLAGATATKNEGAAGALLALVSAAIVIRRRDARRELACAAAMLLLAILPWRLWVAAHHEQTEEPLRRLADPGYLVHHLDRIPATIGAIAGQLFEFPVLGILASIAAGLVGLNLVRGPHRTLAGFSLVLGLSYLGALVAAYTISILPVAFNTGHGAFRVIVPVLFLGVCALIGCIGADLLGPAPQPCGRTSRERG